MTRFIIIVKRLLLLEDANIFSVSLEFEKFYEATMVRSCFFTSFLYCMYDWISCVTLAGDVRIYILLWTILFSHSC